MVPGYALVEGRRHHSEQRHLAHGAHVDPIDTGLRPVDATRRIVRVLTSLAGGGDAAYSQPRLEHGSEPAK